jgi:hypothetical protein
MAESKATADVFTRGVRAVRNRGRGVVSRAARRVVQRTAGAGPAVPGRSDGALIGMVEVFEPRQIVGWVVASAAELPVRVTLHVNDLQVAATWADDPSTRNTSSDVRGFRIALGGLWKYCKRSDRVTVRIDDQPLAIAQKGVYKRPGYDGELSLTDLQRKFDEGFIFNQNGWLQLSKKLDTGWQASVIDLYERVGKVVKDKHDYDPFVIYGTLLGQVREGNFIGHDVDFDTAFISRFTEGPAAAAEMRDIAFTLIEAGFDVECKNTALHVHDGADSSVRIDLFHLYFDEKGEIAFPFGIAGRSTFTRADWHGVGEGQLAKHTVRVPVDAEKLAEHIYGASWRTPIAGFHWSRARTGWRRDGWIPPVFADEVYWANFYARHELAEGSTFADFVVSRDCLPTAVLDIGCGDGRDSFAFARAGRRARGLDRSHVGIQHASAKAETTGLGATLSFVAGDVGDAATVHEIVKQTREAADGEPLLFYMRFLLHAIPEETQETLMTALAEAAQDNDVVAAEFRTDKDESKKKVYGNHYRRYQDGYAFGRALRERYGFAVEHEEEGTGLAPYKDEDPVLYRVIAKKAGSTELSRE